jgi:hypothetical protein
MNVLKHAQTATTLKLIATVAHYVTLLVKPVMLLPTPDVSPVKMATTLNQQMKKNAYQHAQVDTMPILKPDHVSNVMKLV